MSGDFFAEPLDQSKVKGQIVAKYFYAWAKIVAPQTNSIAYIDLFAGQGYYKDGTESTPLLVLKKAIDDFKIGQKLRSEFNDKNSKFIKDLQKAIEQLRGIESLPRTPQFSNMTVSKEIVNRYAHERLPPTLFFLDPWGYKGLSLDLIRAAIKDWASECLLFFNYNRINMDLHKPLVDKNINELFGKVRADNLRAKTIRMLPYKREEAIIQEFCEALREMGGMYSLPFCFQDRKKERTSHYLIHVAKHKRGYALMKEIMAGYSRKDEDGVPTYTFDPKPTTQLMLNFNRPLRELKEKLVSEFRGQTLKVKAIYDAHQGKTRFLRENYKDALAMLEKENRTQVDIPWKKRPIRNGKRTLGPERFVTFKIMDD